MSEQSSGMVSFNMLAQLRRLIKQLRLITLLTAIIAIPINNFAQPSNTATRIIVVGDHNYPPYEFLDENGMPAGFNIAILKAVCEEMNLDPEIRLGPWSDSLQKLKSGEADMMSGMYYSDGRSDLFHFSMPFIKVSHSIVIRRGTDIKSLEDLAGREVIVQKDDIMHDFIGDYGRSLSIVTVSDPIDALRLLSQGRHDCALLARLQVLYITGENGFNNLRLSGPTLQQSDFCFATLKSNEILLAKLDEGLMLLRASGRYQDIHNEWFGGYERQEQRRKITRYLCLILLPILFLIVLLIAWNYTLRHRITNATAALRKELEQRQATERALRRSEVNLKTTLDSIGDAVIVTDTAGRITRMNPVAEKLTAWPRREAKGLDMTEVFRIVNTSSRAPASNPAARVLEKGEVVGLANHTTLISRDGKEHHIADSAAPIQDATGDITGVVLVFRDISNEYRMNQELRDHEKELTQLLAEKEVLLREVHHRVKNNLAVIIGLINLQQNAQAPDFNGIILNDLSRRIKAMAILHEMLYRSDNLSHIKLDGYFRALELSLRESFADRKKIKLRMTANDITLNLDIAVPCGLIINELVTNAYKHAFPDDNLQPGHPDRTITVTAEQADNACRITIADNGRGLPPGLDWAKSPTLGLRLVRMLAQHQLRGKVEVDQTGGTTFRIQFNLPAN